MLSFLLPPRARGLIAALLALTALPCAWAQSASSADQAVLDAREALRKRDLPRLAALRDATQATAHPLAMWVDYWALSARLDEATQDELDAFYRRWPGSYVEDRLRNDWLLVLGKRRDWEHFRVEYPRFQMDDDREVRCHALLVRHLDGEDIGTAGRDTWLAQQRDTDEGCGQLASVLYAAHRLDEASIWRKARIAVEANRSKVARQAVELLSKTSADAVDALSDQPARYLARKASARNARSRELAALALIRLAATDPAAAAQQMDKRWDSQLPPATAVWVWASIGKQAALKLSHDASDYFQRAAMPRRHAGPVEVDLPDDTLAWKLRAALRANGGHGRWQQVIQAINAMSPDEQADPAWLYWKARALQALAPDSQDGEGMVAEARELLASIASPLHFYGRLAAEELGRPNRLPPPPPSLTPEERDAASAHPGLQRALSLIDIGLRNEGVREWNFSLRGMDDRELLAAAQLACDHEVWDRCINTSERTRFQVDMAQRFPTPFRQDVVARSRETGIDPAYVYGLIRQESRFITDARSGAGASGLMQLMPATARWTARKLGLPDYHHGRITDRNTNLQIGTGYLKLILDSFSGSQALAAAGYNAGPNRPRKWREGPMLDAAAWAENVPFSETRDYVKKVLSNATSYAELFTGEAQSLRDRLGTRIGPSSAPLSTEEQALP